MQVRRRQGAPGWDGAGQRRLGRARTGLHRHPIAAVETGGCPHTAVRDDISQNLDALARLMDAFHPELLFVESGAETGRSCSPG